MNKKNILTWVLFFLIFFTIAQFFQKKQDAPPPMAGTAGAAITVTPASNEYATGQEVIVKIRNNTASEVVLPNTCPKNPFTVLALVGEKWEARSLEAKINCDLLSKEVKLAPGKEEKVSYTYWNYSLFGKPGKYKVEVALNNGTTTGVFASPEFNVVEAGLWRKFFRTVFYQPIYNVLVLFISIAPWRDLGLAIIFLTLVIRLILLVPSQHAMISQRKMQELQPRLQQIQKKYVGNKERIAQETMSLWKENKVNPFGSCLPILVQFPVLIALFYVIQNGLNPDNTYLIYNPLKDVDLTRIHTNFLGILELTRVNTFVLPLIIGALQFFQLKLAMMKKKKSENAEAPKSEMETANKMMTYVMPVMIAMFTASVPAGVGLYWGISTLFALGQQLVVNRKTTV